MAKYKQLSYGSSGSDVTELQKLLNSTGNYTLDEDGIYGDQTRAAVEDYQRKNNLTVDGIAGDETFGSLTGFKPTPGATTTMGATSGGNTDTGGFDYGGYEPSDAVKQAEALLQEQMANKPGEYQSQYGDQIAALVGQITNRGPFSYDVNADAMYQQMADLYAQQGKMAMMDTMGQAAAMTGGYGNSYAQSVGQQAYQQHLQGLTEMVPDFYQMALNQYLQEGESLYDQVALLGAQDEQAYGRHRDAVNDYYDELQRLYSQYNAERDYDYGRYADERDFAYGEYRDSVSDDQWQKEYDESVRQYNQNYALSQSKGSGSGGGGGNAKKIDGAKGDQPEGTVSYATASSAQIAQALASAGNAAAAEALGERMIAEGADEDIVWSWYQKYYDPAKGTGGNSGGSPKKGLGGKELHTRG